VRIISITVYYHFTAQIAIGCAASAGLARSTAISPNKAVQRKLEKVCNGIDFLHLIAVYWEKKLWRECRKLLPKALKKFADEKNYPILGDSVRCTRYAEPVGFGLLQGGSVYIVSAPVDPNTWSKELQKEIKTELKKVGAISYNQKESIVQMTVKAGGGAEKLHARLEDSADTLVQTLARHQVAYRKTCLFCGQGECDDFADQGAACVPAHTSCKADAAEKLMAEVVENETNGNYILAILCALLGGIVGALPSALTILLFETIYAVLFALIPLAAYYGYKLARGKMNGTVPFIIAIAALLDTMVLEVAVQYIWVRQEAPTFPLSTFLSYVFSGEGFPLLLQDAAMPLLFCIVGIAIVWGQINNNNRQIRQKAQQLAQGTSSTPK